MVNSCCAYGCINRFKRGCRVGFFRFPRNENRRKQWVLAIKRRCWKPTEETRICSEHFQTGKPSCDPSHPDYVPSIFTFKSLKTTDSKGEKKKIIEKKASLQIQARKRNADESEGMRRRRLKLSALPSQCLPTSRPLEDEKIKRKKKQRKISKARRIVKAGTIDASSKIQKTPPTDSSSRSVLNYRLIDSHKALHLPTTNESNSYINISDSSVHSPLLEKEIKVEIPWEKEYNFIENFTNENERCDASDQDEVASTSSTLSIEDPENSMLDISTKKISQKKDSSSENIESRKITGRNEEKINNSEESVKRKIEELSGNGRYFNIKKLGKCKIGPREETFGRFIACEMSDLSENPVLYLKTKQIILRALIDAHIELTNSYL